MSTETKPQGAEFSFIFVYPEMDEDFGPRMVVADGETAEEAEVRARHIATIGANRAPAKLIRRTSTPPDGFASPYTDVRGLTWLQNDRFHDGVLLPSFHRLLERVNFHPDGTSTYYKVGIGQEDALWLVRRLADPEEWLVFEIDATSFSREAAIKIVKGGADQLRCALLERGCKLSPQEKEQLRQIRHELGTRYEQCAGCHLFVEPNSSEGPGVAEYVHLHRGTPEDEKIDSSHEARPSGRRRTLAYWKEHGPDAMKARFTS